MKVVLFDIDSKIPNLALMKLSSFHKSEGYHSILSKKPRLIPADLYFASAVFNYRKSREKIDRLKKLYGDRITIGGTGEDLEISLAEETERFFPITIFTLIRTTHWAS